jgi:hypothetical protein
VWLGESLLRRCAQCSPRFTASGGNIVRSAKDFLAATTDPLTVGYVDGAALEILGAIDHVPLPTRVVAICEEPIATAVTWLRHPFLSNVVSAATVEDRMGEAHLDNVTRSLQVSQPRLLDWVEATLEGRRVRLTHASRRHERLDRMTTYFEEQGVGRRLLEQARDVAEELLTNAFYDAPVAAGAFKKPISRTQDVALPDDSACDLTYGFHGDQCMIRVRDPFGSLTRRRLVDVLLRCSRTDMQVVPDESMGGAGLGLWRIFAAATFVGVSVINDRHTEFLVAIGKRSAAKPYAFHFFFREGRKRRFWRVSEEETSKPSVNRSVTIQQAKL